MHLCPFVFIEGHFTNPLIFSQQKVSFKLLYKLGLQISQLHIQTVLMEKLGLLMVSLIMKEGLKSVMAIRGALYVMMVGVTLMLTLYVNNLATNHLVC